MALRDQPYLPLFIQDFLTDEKLIECSAQATGVYIRLMCIMHKSDEYGKILLKQKDKQTTEHVKNFALKLAKQMPYSLEIIIDSLTELLNEKVLIFEGDYIIQKRMVRDNDISYKRSISGKKGGEFAQAKIKAKDQANSENEIEYENENDFNIKNGEEKKQNEIPYQKIVDSYNKICKSLPKVQSLSDSRKNKIKTRWVEIKTIESFEALFTKTESLAFLKGDNDKNWKASFDWLIENDKNWLKVMEGNYDKNKSNGAHKQTTKYDSDGNKEGTFL